MGLSAFFGAPQPIVIDALSGAKYAGERGEENKGLFLIAWCSLSLLMVAEFPPWQQLTRGTRHAIHLLVYLFILIVIVIVSSGDDVHPKTERTAHPTVS